jgi:hypothetical protein
LQANDRTAADNSSRLLALEATNTEISNVQGSFRTTYTIRLPCPVEVTPVEAQTGHKAFPFVVQATQELSVANIYSFVYKTRQKPMHLARMTRDAQVCMPTLPPNFFAAP